MINKQFSSSRIVDFQQRVLGWYANNARDLPWRKTNDPYKIRISETMLCQTQVARVIGYYERWIRLFPTIQALADASNEDVLRAWSGLGYNSRALRLKQAARMIAGGQSFPNKYDDLITLPGVGEYTACAVLAFAYNQDVVVLDTNIRRIMIYEFAVGDDTLMGQLQTSPRFEQQRLHDIAQKTLPIGQARTWYNALMDYGAMVLTPIYTGITPRSKQSSFDGSTRQVRAALIKKILSQGVVTLDQVALLYPERNDLGRIISKMIQDNLIVAQGNNLLISA